MTTDLKIDGVTLTLDECREALAFWDHESTHVPWCLTVHKHCHADPTEYPRTLRVGDAPLTPEIVETLRDHVTPWTEVRRRDVPQGERYVMCDTGKAYEAGPCGRGRACGWYVDWCTDEHRATRVHPDEVCRVRRPRKPQLTLRDTVKKVVLLPVAGETTAPYNIPLRNLGERPVGNCATLVDEETWEVYSNVDLDTPVILVDKGEYK